jgi:hypothetical protein
MGDAEIGLLADIFGASDPLGSQKQDQVCRSAMRMSGNSDPKRFGVEKRYVTSISAHHHVPAIKGGAISTVAEAD